MEYDPRVPPYSTSDEKSFAHISAVSRWPTIITSAIDDVHRTVGETSDPEFRKEGKGIIEQLAKLKYEIQHDRVLEPLFDDGEPDIAGYNGELKQRGPPKWLDVSWLYSECYLYRRIQTYFSRTALWRSYDVFGRSKLDTFKSSRTAVLELANRYKDLMEQLKGPKATHLDADQTRNAEQLLFEEMAEICLWGNSTDLSLLTNLSYEDIARLQDAKKRKAEASTVLVNDIPKAFEALKNAQESKPAGQRRVDIVLDNAGFELFSDLILAGYLLRSGLASVVVLHPKSLPWFVSDVVPADFGILLNSLADPVIFYATSSKYDEDQSKSPKSLTEEEEHNLKFLFEDWSQLHADGKLLLRPNRFWTHGGSFWRMPKTAPDLYEDLRGSDLVIFKGDLNGRKLTGDVMWDPTTSFAESLGPLGEKGSGLRVLQLRTCKADVVTGLKPGEDERVRQTEGGGGDSGQRKWAWTGKWALVQYSDAL